MLCRPCGLLAELVDARDSEGKLSAPVEMPGAEPLKVGEGLTANPEPSPSDREGVETGRAAPKAARAAMVKGQSRPRTRKGRRKPKWYENRAPRGVPVRVRGGPPNQIFLGSAGLV
jgi:hypothetical protein